MPDVPSFLFVWMDNDIITKRVSELYGDLCRYCALLATPLSVKLSGTMRDGLSKDEIAVMTCRAVFITSSQLHIPLLQPLLTTVRRLGKTTIVLQDTKTVDSDLLAADTIIIPFQNKDPFRRAGQALRDVIATGILPDEPPAYTSSMVLTMSAADRPSGWFIAERPIAFGDRWRLAVTEMKALLLFTVLAGLVLTFIIRPLTVWGNHSVSPMLGLFLIACCSAGITGAVWLWLLVQARPADVVMAGPHGYAIRRGGELSKNDYRRVRTIAATSSRTGVCLEVTDDLSTLRRFFLPRRWRPTAAFVQYVMAGWDAQQALSSSPLTPHASPPAPVIMVSFVEADRALARRITTLFQERGMTVAPVVIGSPLPALSAVCLLLISPASQSHPQIESVAQLLQQRGIPIIPLAFVTHQALPGRLQSLQWVDFSRSWKNGWRALALALETYIQTTMRFDVDAILERYTRGVIPPTWRVSREPPTRVTFEGVLMLGITFVLLLGGGGISIFVTPPGPFIEMIPTWRDSISVLVTIIGIIGIFGGLALLYALIWAVQNMFQGNFRQQLTIILPTGFVYQWGRRITALAFTQISGIEKPPNAVGAANYFFVAKDSRRYPIPDSAVLSAYQRFVEAEKAVSTSAAAPPTARQFVFISHARKDAAVIDHLDRELQGCGIETWVDRRRLQGGQAWPTELQEAIATCSVLLVVVTPQALASSVVQQEYRAALAAGKPVIAWIARPVSRHVIPADLQACLLASQPTKSVAPVIIGCNDLGLGPNCFDEATVKANPEASARLLLVRVATQALPADVQTFRRQFDVVTPLRASFLALTGIFIVTIGAPIIHLQENFFFGVVLLLLTVYLCSMLFWLEGMLQRDIAVVATDRLLVCHPSSTFLRAYLHRNGIEIDSKGNRITDRALAYLTDMRRFGDVRALTQALVTAYERYQAENDHRLSHQSQT